MRLKKVSPSHLLTLCDFPVHNEHILKMYFRMFQKGSAALVPPCPVLRLSPELLRLPGKTKKERDYNHSLQTFLAIHPKASYVILDGSHKTTAAALAHAKIPVIILENDQDIKQIHALVQSGDLLSFAGSKTIQENIDDLKKHFFKHARFETVAEKTKRMMAQKVVPEYMIVKL